MLGTALRSRPAPFYLSTAADLIDVCVFNLFPTHPSIQVRLQLLGVYRCFFTERQQEMDNRCKVCLARVLSVAVRRMPKIYLHVLHVYRIVLCCAVAEAYKNNKYGEGKRRCILVSSVALRLSQTSDPPLLTLQVSMQIRPPYRSYRQCKQPSLAVGPQARTTVRHGQVLY